MSGEGLLKSVVANCCPLTMKMQKTIVDTYIMSSSQIGVFTSQRKGVTNGSHCYSQKSSSVVTLLGGF